MNTVKTILAAAIAATTLSVPALAQQEEFKLPEQCTASSAMGGMDHSATGHGMSDNQAGGMGAGMMGMEGMDMDAMTDFQRENMEKMMVTMPAMMDAMTHDDPDVAFACAMIAHHQGAIDMARIQLEYGKDEWTRGLVEEIIAAQVKEIEEMTQWLTDNAN